MGNARETPPDWGNEEWETPAETKRATSAAEVKVYRFSDLLSMEVEPIPDVVEGFIPGESVTMYSGDGGLGKSYVLVEMALQVSQGLPWLGMETTKRHVVVIDLENRLRRVALRIHKIGKGWSLRKDIDYDVSFIFESDLQLSSDKSIENLYALIERLDAGLIILDSLTDFIAGMDENGNAEMAEVCKRLRDIAGRTRCSILCIHHVAKGGANQLHQSARGASALKDNTDCSIQVVRAGPSLVMRHDKARDFPYKSIKIRLNWEGGVFNTELIDSGNAGKCSSGDKGEQAILDCLTGKWRKRSVVIQEAKSASGSSQTTLDRKMKALIDNGLVREDTDDAFANWGSSTGVKLA